MCIAFPPQRRRLPLSQDGDMRRIGMAVLSLGLIAGPLLGQRSALREVHDRGAFGADFVVAQPLGEFRRNGDVAGGLSIFGVTSGGALALRIDASWMAYDAQYLSYGVSTTSQIGTIGAGPQLTLGSGAFRVYGFATMGGALLGLTAGRTPIAIDVGARGVRHDRVTYVPAGGLTQNPDGSFTARQVTTPVDMRVYQIGVSIGIR